MGTNNFDNSGVMELTRNVFLMAIIAIFFIIIFLLLVYFFAKRHPQAMENTNSHVFEQRGLDETFLKTIRVVRFDPESFKEGLQCAVCLSEVKEGEETRVLPECDHAFHMECIDMWFRSHSTCPICRNPVGDQSEISVEIQDSITVLLDGNHEADNNRKGSTSELASSSSSPSPSP